jgi:hypothetical protein
MRTMEDMIDDMRNLSKQFDDGEITYEETMPILLKLKSELQDRVDLLSLARSSS